MTGDLDVLFARVRAQGRQVLVEPFQSDHAPMRAGFTADPEGHVIENIEIQGPFRRLTQRIDDAAEADASRGSECASGSAHGTWMRISLESGGSSKACRSRTRIP